MLIKYTGNETITATTNNVYCPNASAYWYTGSLSPKGFTYIVNGILDDGNNSTSDDFSYNTKLKSGFTAKFKTASTLYSESHKPTYVWSYISLLPKYDNTLFGNLTKSTTYVEVRERATRMSLKVGDEFILPPTYTIKLSYSKGLSYTLYPENCYHKDIVFKQEYGYNNINILNNEITITPNKVGEDILYCYSLEYNNKEVLLGKYKTICTEIQTPPLYTDEETLTTGDGSNNGHNYVDLGLPSGTMWATCNVGGNLATSDGWLFQFGKTDGYEYGNTNNTFTKGSENESITGNSYINPTTSGTKYSEGQTLSLSDDMARANMGGDWIMPNKADLEELYDNTTRKVVTINDKKGMLFTSKLNRKYIFVVFAGRWDCRDGQFYNRGYCGHLWSSEVHSSDVKSAWFLYACHNDNCQIHEYGFGRASGCSVRGVLKGNYITNPPIFPPPVTTPPPTPTPTPTPTGTPTPTPTPTPTGTPTPTPTGTPTPTPTGTPTLPPTTPPPTTPPPTTPPLDVEKSTAGDGTNNGYSYIDLGLPSGTKWATCNVGGNFIYSDGLLFQFGRTDGYYYGDTNNTFTTGPENEELTGNAYINPTTSGTIYDKGQTLSLSDDMARANMGGDWIMPTKDDMEELYKNTTRQVMTINGKQGMLFTSKLNGKSIFVVCAGYWNYANRMFELSGPYGYIWSSEVNPSDSKFAWRLTCYCHTSNFGINSSYRASAFPVRGVLK